MRAVTARWRGAGYAVTGVLGPGPAWCWLTPAGMAACGHPWPARAPSLSRLAHVRAVLAARLWLQSSPAWHDAGAWWRSERRIRADLPPPRIGTGSHVADGEIHWPSSPPGPHAGQVWAVEVELTPKPAARTARIMAGLLARPGYAQVVYLVSAGGPAGGGGHRCRAAPRAAGAGRGARPARLGVPARAGTPVSLLRALALIWLLRQAFRLARLLLTAADPGRACGR